MLGRFVGRKSVPSEENMIEELRRVAKEINDTVGVLSGDLKEVRKY